MKEDTGSGSFWKNIGHLIIDNVGESDGVFAYIECESAHIGGQIYIERENDVEQGNVSFHIFLPVLERWEALDPKTRWSAVRYSIDDGRFRVAFDYFDREMEDADGIDHMNERMSRAFTERFGNKPMRPFAERHSE